MADNTTTDKTTEGLRQLRATVEALVKGNAGSMTQTELYNAQSLFPDFTPGAFYRTRQLVRFEGLYYFVLTDTWATTGEGNRPDKDTKAYKLMGTPDENGVFPFNAPLGEADAYGIGDKVLVQGDVYVSHVDHNVSIPGKDDGLKNWVKQ